ncbi:hypothetical protein [Hyphomicrobium sp.]|jgi:hypothetical protein|uniref:hypothetical protein n=1 Tax=Hyphomicrobium sp. TaxID=82 RepID=UPI00356A06C8
MRRDPLGISGVYELGAANPISGLRPIVLIGNDGAMKRAKKRKPAGWPRYMESRRLRFGTTGYYWKPPSWSRPRGCTMQAEPLGPDYGAAVTRCELLNRQLDSWRLGRDEGTATTIGTFKWISQEFFADRKFLRTDAVTQRDYRDGLALIEEYELKNGTRFGAQDIRKITANVVDKLYEKLSIREDGTKRTTTANKAMRAARRAWNVVFRRHPKLVPESNPFSRMGLEKTGGDTSAATREQLNAFVAAADELGYASIGTAAMISFELLLREVDIIGRFAWSQYKPPERPDAIKLRHYKNRKGDERSWMPLFQDGVALLPELTDRLDKSMRHGPLVIMSEAKRGGVKKPYERTYFAQLVRKIRDKADLPSDLTFTSFRHGGVTEIGDADVSDQGALSLTGHKTRDILSIYMKRTEAQRVTAARARLEHRSGRLTNAARS